MTNIIYTPDMDCQGDSKRVSKRKALTTFAFGAVLFSFANSCRRDYMQYNPIEAKIQKYSKSEERDYLK